MAVNSSKCPLMWDISYDSVSAANYFNSVPYGTGHYWCLPDQSNHPIPGRDPDSNGTAAGENILFVDGHVEWRNLTEGYGQLWAYDYYQKFYQ